MSIQRMRRRFAVHLRYVLYAIIAVFVIGLPFMFTPGLSRRREDEGAQSTQDIIARVNGEPLRRPRLEQHFKQTMGQLAPIYQAVGRPLGLSEIPNLRVQAFESAVTA